MYVVRLCVADLAQSVHSNFFCTSGPKLDPSCFVVQPRSFSVENEEPCGSGRRTFRVCSRYGSRRFDRSGAFFRTVGNSREKICAPERCTANNHTPCQIYLNRIGVPRAHPSGYIMYTRSIILSMRPHFGAQTTAHRTAPAEFHTFATLQ